MKRTKNKIDEHKKIWSEPRRKSLTKEIAYGFTRGSGDFNIWLGISYLGGKFWDFGG